MRNCPFCGLANIRMTSRDTSYGAYRANKNPKFQVRCNTCNARGPIKRTEQEAWDTWNGERSTTLPLFEQEDL